MKKLYTANYGNAIAAGGTDDHYFQINEPGMIIKIVSVMLSLNDLNVTALKFVPWAMNQDVGFTFEIGNGDQFASPMLVVTPGTGFFVSGSNIFIYEPGQYWLDNTVLVNSCLFRLGLTNASAADLHDLKIQIVIEAEMMPIQ